MKLNKAIETLEDLARLFNVNNAQIADDRAAIKLGLEALKAIQILRGTGMASNLWSHLPGEDTEEVKVSASTVSDPRD